MKNIFLKPILMLVFLVGLFSIAPVQSHAESSKIYTGFLSNVAVQGYDPVAYFTKGQPIKGSKAYQTMYQGAEFHFSSQENLDAFIKTPEVYAPQFGGYCAWAVSQGYTAKGDARHWSIVDDKLYLNYNSTVQKQWQADQSNLIAAGHKNWPKVLK